jgi:gliding motility-associated-like protein
MSTKQFISTLLGCLVLMQVQAQKQGNIWHFGHSAAIDFNSGTAVVTTPSSMSTFEGSASIADSDGNLLFYTNGGGRDPILSGQSSGKIWNRNHQEMYDMGNTEGGGFSAAQSSVIIPKPGDPNHYYLFTMEEIEFNVGGSVPGQPVGRGLSYFDVDMSLNGGLGGVANYEGMILTPSYEGLCAVRHTNGSDYWIVIHNDESGLAVFPVNASGVGNPSFFNVADGTNGIIKASPDGKWLSCGVLSNQALFRFDASTGDVNGLVQLNEPQNAVEFSPNSKRLFAISSDKTINYFDLSSPDINGSRVEISTISDFGVITGQMQLAPDGKIYFLQSSFLTNMNSLSTIVCPNTSPFVEFNKIGFDIVNGQIFYGLPNFDNAIFRRDVDPPLPVNLGPDQTVCGNQSIVLDAGVSNATYAWSNGAPTQTITAVQSGVYTVTVTASGCGVGVDSIVVNQIQLNVDAGDDLTICAGDTPQLEGSGNGTLLWSPGNLVSNPDIAAPFFTGNSSATLTLTATQGICSLQDVVEINVTPAPIVSVLTKDTTINAGASVQLTGMGMGTVLWSPAAGLSCTDCLNPVANPDSTTTYTLTVTNAAGCSARASVTITVTPPDCDPQVPNVFTPNGDSVNDNFQPIGAVIESFDLTVYNRWGQQVYAGNAAWDGQADKINAPSDVYVYRTNVQVCGQLRVFSGQVTLLR